MHYNQGADLLTYLTSTSLPVFAVKNGFVEAPVRPGLGIELDEALIREVDAKKGDAPAWRNLTWRGVDGALREW